MATTDNSKQYTFQAEIKQLLHLLSHSLYQNKEIAIRELVSNASDAIDKLKHNALTNKDIDATNLEIRIEPNKEENVLVIRDNGIGMTDEELIANIGTIAHSGSLDFMTKLQDEGADNASLIGQFGVGFYSAFMLADKVEVLTRSFASEQGYRWESDGSGSFEITEVADVDRGTQVRLHLKKDLEEFTDTTRLKYIITKYSTFVPQPIKLDGEHINDQPPIWVEPKSQLTDEQYNDFYSYLTHMPDQKPRWHLHLSADSPFQFYSILYCPQSNFEKMGFGRMEQGMHVCAKRILVQNDNKEVLPEYLRFISGLVDSADLPLNVSRETLQDNTVFRKMRKVLVKKVLDHLISVAEDSPADYLDFYKEFGMTLREGISNDYDNRDRIAKLMRFQSSHASGPDDLISLDSYIERASDDQKQIFFLGGVDRNSIERNPNLEIFRKRNLEVLYLVDAADEFVLSQLGKYGDHDITSIDSADLKLPDVEGEDKDEETKKDNEPENKVGFDRVLELFKESIGDGVVDVRKSERLTDSACCVVNEQGGMSTQMQKVLQMNQPGFEMSKLILEVNPNDKLITRLADLSANTQHDEFIRNCGHQFYANAMVVAGLSPDAETMAHRVESFMQELAESRSSIIQ
ncbi:UNVERIFIED_CONTAM: hypothetical protein GTU68_041565 [Idotea baltica]|nr:hypothetical protein [Idotea baltica]